MKNKCLTYTIYITGTVWIRHKGTPKLETVQKPADFLRKNLHPQAPLAETKKEYEKRIGGEMLYSVQSGLHDLYRVSVFKLTDCLVPRYQSCVQTNSIYIKLYLIHLYNCVM